MFYEGHSRTLEDGTKINGLTDELVYLVGKKNKNVHDSKEKEKKRGSVKFLTIIVNDYRISWPCKERSVGK